MQKVALFDGTSLLVRCCKVAGVSLQAGQVPTGPLFMFLSSLSRRLREFEPTHVAVAWDGLNGRYYRTQVFPEYKAGREPFHGGPQFELASEACRAAGIFQHSADTSEADDVIGTMWRMMRLGKNPPMPDAEIAIFSDDADLRQLVDDHTVVYSVNDERPWDLQRVRDHYGCEPDQVPMLRALAGDKSDGIPGIEGIGPKKGLKILGEADWQMESLPFGLIPKSKAILFYSIMNLSFWNAEGLPVGIEEALRWDPAAERPALRDFLERFEMASFLVRLDRGTLWRKTA